MCKHLNFRDVNIKIEGENLITKLFEKKKLYFNFKTLNLLHFDSTTPISIKRNMFKNDIIRIKRLI